MDTSAAHMWLARLCLAAAGALLPLGATVLALWSAPRVLVATLDLELKAIRRALLSLGSLPGTSPYLAVKASRSTLLSDRFRSLMADTDVRRVVIELNDHDPATDYAARRS